MHHYGNQFRILHGILSQSITSELTQMDLTSAQGRIIGYLAHCPEPSCPKDLEEHFHLTHPTVSGLLARMEKKEFLELRPDSNDRRCKRIYLLPRGQECHERISGIIQQTEARIVRGFTQEEKDCLSVLLDRAVQNLGERPDANQKEESEQ